MRVGAGHQDVAWRGWLGDGLCGWRVRRAASRRRGSLSMNALEKQAAPPPGMKVWMVLISPHSRPLHRHDQRQFTDQGAGARDGLSAPPSRPGRLRRWTILLAGVRRVAVVETVGSPRANSRLSEPIASMRYSAVIPNRASRRGLALEQGYIISSLDIRDR